MGLIRLLLALSVVSAHFSSHPLLKLVGGDTAVQAFFIISGFYITMIYPRNYQSKTSFWKARFFRLYPVYLFCGLFSLGMPWKSLHHLVELPLPAALYVVFSNCTMLFQDASLFFQMQDGQTVFTADFIHAAHPLSDHMLLSQAWTLGLEISFYLLAPFVVISPIRILLLLAASIATRLWLIHQGFTYDPWNHRFFPTELALFLLGSLSYLVAQKIGVTRTDSNARVALLLLAGIAVFIVGYPFIPWVDWQKKILLYAVLTAAIPLVFALTKQHAVDNLVGNLSYPVYCCHLIILGWVAKIPLWKTWMKGTLPGAVIAIAAVIGFSYLLYQYVELPFDRYRARYRRPAGETA